MLLKGGARKRVRQIIFICWWQIIHFGGGASARKTGRRERKKDKAKHVNPISRGGRREEWKGAGAQMCVSLSYLVLHSWA